MRPFERIRSLVVRHERHLSSGAFLAGFLVDSFTLTRIDFWVNHVIIFGYGLLVTLLIVALQLKEGGRIRRAWFIRLSSFIPIIIQFAFGALFSALMVFYARSASLSGSLVFIAFLAGIMIGNEFLRDRYGRLEFQVTVFFVIIFAVLIFYVPIILNAIDTWVFLVSGIASLLLVALLISLLYQASPNAVKRSSNRLVLWIGGIYLLVNALYFSNTIPPIPLSLKAADVYHYVGKEDGHYVGFREGQPRWQRYVFPHHVHYRTPGESVYFYSAIFAPTAITVPIYHEWQRYDEREESWVTKSVITFPVVGGREEGYRGYSMKTSVEEGRWRVLVKTERGGLLGKSTFIVSERDTPRALEKEVLK